MDSDSDDERERQGLLDNDDDYDASKYKIPILKQQLLMRSQRAGGTTAKMCMIVSLLGIVFLSTIAITLSRGTLYANSLTYAEDEERRSMIDGLAGAVVIYAITGSFSALLVYLSARPSATTYFRQIAEYNANDELDE
jgi:hypothetical protein